MNAPVIESMLAPTGAPTRLNVSSWAGTSGSVAVAVNPYATCSSIVALATPLSKEKFGEDQIQTQECNLAGNGKSSILGTSGLVKLVRQKDGPVIGVHMIGARMGEQIGEAQLIVNWEAYPEDVAQLVHAHPTQNESLGEAHLALAGKPLHG